MKSRLTRFLAVPALAGSLLTLSCGGSDGGAGPVGIASVSVSPGSVTLTFIGATRQLTATVRDDAGGTASVTVTWTSSDPSAVAVSSSGVVTAVRTGSASITASAGGKTSTPVLISVNQEVASVQLSASSLSFQSLGETQTLTATTVDQGGAPVDGGPVNWITTNEEVVAVTSAGVVTAVGNGSATVRATSGTASGSASIVVQQVAATAELTSPAAVSFNSLGQATVIGLEARDAMDRFIESPGAVFTSSDPAVASVSALGRVIAAGNGTATISAMVDQVAVPPVQVTVTQVVASVTLAPRLLVLSSIGATEELTATPTDALGSAVDDAPVTWTSSDPAIASVNSAGTVGATGSANAMSQVVTVTAHAEGIAAITASSSGFSSPPVEAFVGSGQVTDLPSGERITDLAGPAGFQRIYKISVPAGAGELHVGTGGGTDFAGNGPGDLDLFLKFGQAPTNDFNDESQLASGNPANEEFIQVLDPQSGDWYLLVDGFVDQGGSGPGYSGVDLAATVKTEAQGFDIRLEFISDFTPAQRQQIRQAADRWEAILPQDLFSIWLNIPSSPSPACGIPGLSINTYIDDVVVLVALFDEAPGGTLASAGPCQIRRGSNQDLLPIIAFMAFDLQDLDALEASNQLEETALHELGHVMGVGSLWVPPTSFTLPSLLNGGGGDDPYFTGPLARQAFDDAGGTTYSGLKVPVENTGEGGTRDSHWRESVLNDELMTGFAESEPIEKLSAITIQSLLDIGWPQVDIGQADVYQLPGSSGAAAVAPEEARKGMPRGDDVLLGDLYAVGADGESVLIRSGSGIPPALVRRILR